MAYQQSPYGSANGSTNGSAAGWDPNHQETAYPGAAYGDSTYPGAAYGDSTYPGAAYGGSAEEEPTYLEVERPPRRRRRRGRALLTTLLVLVIVFGVLLAVADRVAVSVVEQRLADEVSGQLDTRGVRSSPPNVTVGGFPFLTQVLAENLQSISISLNDVTADPGQTSVRIPRLDVVARDISAPIDTLRTGQGDIVAKTIEGTATIDYASVAELAKQPGLRLFERDGKLLATMSVPVLRRSITLTGEAELTPIEGGIRVEFRRLTGDGLADSELTRSAVDRYARAISVDVPLPEMPFGIEVRQIQPRPEGLAVKADARDVALNEVTQ